MNSSPAYHEKKPVRLQATFQILLVLSIVSAVLYLAFLLNTNIVRNWPLYIALIGIELYVIIQTVIVWWTALYSENNAKDHHYYTHRKELLKSSKIPGGVDVFITTYNEDIAIIRTTAIAARDMKIEHNTIILDDGESKDVERLAKELGIDYITRTEHTHAKAGNVNHGLSRTKGAYVAVFDADFVPRDNFLIETLPFFHDDEIAFVQTPQVLGNRTNMFSTGSSDAQQVFYGLIGAGKNRFNSMFWVGTNAVFRRKAIESVGGIFSHTSEDILTSYRMHQQGWKSMYIPDALAIGQGPDSLIAYMKQQLRWAGGGLYMLLRENPLFKKLSFDQKIQYFSVSTFYLSGFVVLGMLLMPLLYLYFDIRPIEVDGVEWATRYIPYLLFQFVLIMVLSGQFSWQSYVISINSFTVYISAFFKALLGRAISWNVSTGALKKVNTIKFSILWSHWLLFVLGLLAVPLSLLTPKEPALTAISMIWVLINTATIGTFLYHSYKIK